MGSNIYIAAAGAMARMQQLDVVANNLANAATPGFKRGAPIFKSVLQSSIADAQGTVQSGAASRSFVTADSLEINFAPGPVEQTGAALDLAIDGAGFLEVETPAGLRYTRDGSLVVNRDGLLATAGGFPVMGQGGPIDLGGVRGRIVASGDVVDAEGNSIGKLKLVEFEDSRALAQRGDNLFEAGPGAGPREVEDVRVLPEAREGSNVDPVAELAALVMLQRAFETNLRAIQADDEATNRLIREFTS